MESQFPDDDGSLKFATDAGVFNPALEADIPATRPIFQAKSILVRQPLVFLCFGQSNAANTGTAVYNPGQGVWSFNIFDGEFYSASDPVPGSTGNGGCCWGRMGDLILASSPKVHDVVFVNIAVGGSYLADWLPGREHNRRLVLALERLARHDIGIDRMFWCQGEAEANLTNMSKEQYITQFHEMLKTIRERSITAPIHIAKSTFCATEEHPYDNRAEIRAAHAELVDPSIGLLAGPDTDVIGLEGRDDGCHFNELGLQRAAELWFEEVGKSTSYSKPVDMFSPPWFQQKWSLVFGKVRVKQRSEPR